MNYYRMDEMLQIFMKKISEELMTDYEIKGEFIPVDSLISMIEDLYGEVEHLKEELEDIKQDVEDNYKHVSVQEQLGYDVRTW